MFQVGGILGPIYVGSYSAIHCGFWSITNEGRFIGAMYIDVMSEEDKAYLVVRSLRSIDGTQKGYALKVGDYMKFGRIEYFVK